MSQSPANAGARTVRATSSASVDLPVPGNPEKMITCGSAPTASTHKRLAPCWRLVGERWFVLPVVDHLVRAPGGGCLRERNRLVADDDYQPVTVSRRICAPARHIFQVLADPARHAEFDGSESLRGAGSAEVISGVGDVFVMRMYFPHLGDYEMNNHVVEYEPDRRIGWEPEAGRGDPAAPPGGAR